MLSYAESPLKHNLILGGGNQGEVNLFDSNAKTVFA